MLCTNTPDVLQQSVAELTMMMIGAAARHCAAVAVACGADAGNPRKGVELEGKTLALIGSGAIAQAVARIAAAGFGMRVVGYARTAAAGAEPALRGDDHRLRRGGRRAPTSSACTFPAARRTRASSIASDCALLPPRAWLINTARGAVVDERRAVSTRSPCGRLAGAALDVFAREPYQPADADHDLRTLANVIAVPHIGSNTVEANRRMALRALRNVRLAIDGRLASDGSDQPRRAVAR